MMADRNIVLLAAAELCMEAALEDGADGYECRTCARKIIDAMTDQKFLSSTPKLVAWLEADNPSKWNFPDEFIASRLAPVVGKDALRGTFSMGNED